MKDFFKESDSESDNANQTNTQKNVPKESLE